MLPIDEHAKSGAKIYVEITPGELWLCRWCADMSAFLDDEGGFLRERIVSRYLPACWIENAGKMRKALKDIDRHNDSPVGFDSHINSIVVPVLAATEWPEVKP